MTTLTSRFSNFLFNHCCCKIETTVLTTIYKTNPAGSDSIITEKITGIIIMHMITGMITITGIIITPIPMRIIRLGQNRSATARRPVRTSNAIRWKTI